MGDLGVFEAMANAGKASAAAAAEQGFELEKSVDRAIFRAKERFGAYLANSQSKSDFDERFAGVKPQLIKLIAEVTTPTPGVIRRVGKALRPSLSAPAADKKPLPSPTKTTRSFEAKVLAVPGAPERVAKIENELRTAAVTKTAWSYDQGTKLWTSNDPMQKFACPDCGTAQEHLGFSHCAGCNRTWNSWPVRRQGTDKTSASTYVLMAREVKMRGDQFRMASADNVKIAEISTPASSVPEKIVAMGNFEIGKAAKVEKTADMMPTQPSFGTMPGDNSAAMGAPAASEQPPTPAAVTGDPDHDGDVAGGITEGSPIDQIQDALEGAVVALRDVQMLSINPVLAKTAGAKVAVLRASMDRFWALHKQLNYVAGMLAKEANEAIRTADPRITVEAEFIQGFEAASKNTPLPPAEKTGRAFLEGYIAFHKQADEYSDGANYDKIFEPGAGNDETNGTRNDGTYLDGSGLDDGRADTSDAGPFDTSQPAQQAAARQIDEDNAAGKSRGDQGESSSIQPTGARRPVPKARR